MLRKKCGPFAILAVARQAWGGGWYKDVESILYQKKLLTDEMVFAERTRILKILREKWKAERASCLKRIHDEAAIQARREKIK